MRRVWSTGVNGASDGNTNDLFILRERVFLLSIVELSESRSLTKNGQVVAGAKSESQSATVRHGQSQANSLWMRFVNVVESLLLVTQGRLVSVSVGQW